MLVLNRSRGQSLVINNDVTVTILEVIGDRVKLGIKAPLLVPVVREEIALRMRDDPANDQPLPLPEYGGAFVRKCQARVGSASVKRVG